MDEKRPLTSRSGWHLATAGDNQLVGATHTACLGFVLWEKAASSTLRNHYEICTYCGMGQLPS